jgi:hypothetical protein
VATQSPSPKGTRQKEMNGTELQGRNGKKETNKERNKERKKERKKERIFR